MLHEAVNCSTQAAHLQTWVEKQKAKKEEETEVEVADKYIRWMDKTGRVVGYLALVFGIVTVAVQVWIKFH